MRALICALMMWGGAVHADPVMLAAVNDARMQAVRAPLIYDARLEDAARAHGQDMAARDFFAHTGSDGSDIGVRLQRVGYAYCFGAENIAAGHRSLDAVMAGWMQSRGHRKNILHRKARAVGIARTEGDHWVMVLAAPC